ncbi:hypothetical protein CBR_g15957 [Chara braunii]|uniref:CCHC-type domain-containing protein n=1 Tax=Chara braunii TaxID=69332 RepID=A0A388JSN9_CHABU|nr:hypothetical protein CBR_g15957 [Chara braunii]|eukprot:GBG60834.1 hypothetical protein CBR_g15957 [Chara braunii]
METLAAAATSAFSAASPCCAPGRAIISVATADRVRLGPSLPVPARRKTSLLSLRARSRRAATPSSSQMRCSFFGRHVAAAPSFGGKLCHPATSAKTVIPGRDRKQVGPGRSAAGGGALCSTAGIGDLAPITSAVYGATMGVAGTFAFLKFGSKYSIIAGLSSGSLLALSYWLMQNPDSQSQGEALAFGVSVLLAAVFGLRYFNTKKPLPALPLFAVSTLCPGVQVPVQTVFSQPPSQVAVSGQPAVSQPAQPQGTHPQQQLVQQPGPQGPQLGVGQVLGQSQWVPKTVIAVPKPFTGNKRGEDLDTWLRSVSVYVKCKLTLPHEEVLVAASYLEGRATRWLSGLVQLQGYDHDFCAWAVNQKLDDFLKLVEDRWHDPQEAQKVIDAILTLHKRQKSVREATNTVERLICILGVRYDPQVLLTSYLRCFPMPLRNQLVGEANINMHNFPSFSKKALDLEAKIGHGQTPTTDGKRKSLPPNWKAKGHIMFVDNDGSTIELDDNFHAGVNSETGSAEASGVGVVATSVQKGKATGRRRGGSRSRSQVDPNAPPWEKAGLIKDVWRDRYSRQACIRCGQYGHNQFKCRNKVTEKIPPTMGQALGSSAPVGSNVASSFGSASGNTLGQ